MKNPLLLLNTSLRHASYAMLASLTLFLSMPVHADEAKGLEIAKETKKRSQGWISSTSDMIMILRNKQGQEIERQMRSKSLEVDGDGDKGMTIFDTPLDVKGTAFLSHSHIEGADDQWLYLPALKRVKRIASRNKSGPFLGSEFAFEDLASFEVEKYTYKYLRDDVLNSQDCFVVEMTPLDKYSGYSRVQAWIDKEHYRLQKIDYFDRRGSELKTLTMHDYKNYLDGKIWRADRQHMVNHKTGKSTDMVIENLAFNVDLSDKDFMESKLQRLR